MTAHGTTEATSAPGQAPADHAAGAALASIGVGALAITTFGPDLVSGTEHEHLPLPGLLVWLWAAAAALYVGAASGGRRRALPLSAALAVAELWLGAAALSILGSVLVTGSDPTRVPPTARSAPVFAALATGYVCIRAYAAAAPELR